MSAGSKKFDWKLTQVLNSLKTREEKGIIPPHFVIQRVLDEMRGFVALPPEENILYTSCEEKLAKVELEGEADWLDQVREQIDTVVYPAYHELIAYLEQLEKKAGNDDGAWKHPDGHVF